MESLCIFGDSTAWGAWDLEIGGWAKRLWFYIGNREGDDYLELYNLSISGGTTETILERFENEAKIRHADGIIFQTGANDALYISDPNEHLVSPEKFRANVTEIIKRARLITENIIFMGFEDCDESKTMPVSWGSFYYTNEHLSHYKGIIQDVCSEQGIPYLDVGLLENDEFEDGLHPNAKGHEKIFQRVKEFLVEQKWI
ncbi:MAG: hypothetical protein COU08_04435 [Candidatus Harrisonbacteria bacterium CG10_big_fil_rev_8_21_14_0_10_42_17]|uniref:SGNH hydrolase-type esterase domain-containing protein n=1 Tax=Candidatus Harrisonbacteria bacterium CG10_big_fil_rev_8_21_14_0_10_42_17 TaxID=1974584 RepID=A0A2M6WH02_9BACT|nr:MAG: hypothetical protein COU08_04435 [Candidatus Harrisonbacteria bacterium CG10_big_fil_rev_8_21_14_0_10_42_17]